MILVLLRARTRQAERDYVHAEMFCVVFVSAPDWREQFRRIPYKCGSDYKPLFLESISQYKHVLYLDPDLLAWLTITGSATRTWMATSGEDQTKAISLAWHSLILLIASVVFALFLSPSLLP